VAVREQPLFCDKYGHRNTFTEILNMHIVFVCALGDEFAKPFLRQSLSPLAPFQKGKKKKHSRLLE
jgi:hypothetical protein